MKQHSINLDTFDPATIESLRRGVDAAIIKLEEDSAETVQVTTGVDSSTFPVHIMSGELAQIRDSRTISRAEYYLKRLKKSVSEVKTGKVNDINMNRWKEYDDILTDSLWLIDKRDRSGIHSAGYWGNFIPQIPRQMMKRYTKQGEWVLDTFGGLGTSLIEGQRLGRNTLGIELQQDVADRATGLLKEEDNPHKVCCEMIRGDSGTIDLATVLAAKGIDKVQLLIMHPPYHDIIRFSEDSEDLSNAPDADAFITMMNRVVDNTSPFLEKKRYLIIVIGDKYEQGNWIPLGSMVMNEVMKRDFSLKSIVVKNFEQTTGKRSQEELWKYRALKGGFYIFKHEYIYIFQKTR